MPAAAPTAKHRDGKSGWCLTSVNDCDGCLYTRCNCTCHDDQQPQDTE